MEKVKLLSVMSPYHGDYNSVGALWMGVCITNDLVNHPDVEKVGVLTKFDNYDTFDEAVKIHELSGINSRNLNKNLVGEAVRLVREEGYNILHVHANSMAIIRWLDELVPEDIPLIYTSHLSAIGGRCSITVGPSGRNLTMKPKTRIVSVSRSNSEAWTNFCNSFDHSENHYENIEVIYNTIKECQTEVIEPQNREGLCVCGRITPIKNTKQILQFLHDYKYKATFIGDGFIINRTLRDENNPEVKYIEECKEILSSSPNITWIKSTSNEEVREIMAHSIATIHLSQSEAFGLVVAESLSVGTPVISSTKLGSVVEIMRQEGWSEENGVLIEFKKGSRYSSRAKLVKEAVDKLIENPSDPFKIINYYEKNFSKTKTVSEYLNLYKSLIN